MYLAVACPHFVVYLGVELRSCSDNNQIASRLPLENRLVPHKGNCSGFAVVAVSAAAAERQIEQED